MSTRAKLVGPCVVVPTLMAAACGLVAGDSDSPTSSAASSSTSTPDSSTSSGDEVLDKPQQRTLTKAEIKAALPVATDFPKGWVNEESAAAPKLGVRTADPQDCLELYLEGPQATAWRKDHQVASDAVRYDEPTEENSVGPFVTTIITTHDKPFPREYLDTAGAAVGKCRNFASKGPKDSREHEFRATTLNYPSMGDQSFAIRIGYPDIDLGLDYYYIRSGHNLITLGMIVNSETDSKNLVKAAEVVMENLAKDGKTAQN